MKSIGTLTRGVLAESREKVIDALLYKIDPEMHAATYSAKGVEDKYAEPEFTGKYLDICCYLASCGYEAAKKNADIVVKSILENQRGDGYLGCLDEGKELVLFSIWNQAFTILGLTSYYKLTEDKEVLLASMRCADLVMKPFMEEGLDILDAPNYGTQHISMLLPLCRLYELTKSDRLRSYICHIVTRLKSSDLNFFEFDSILKLRSRKGIENFVVLLGMLEYGKLFDDKSALEGAMKYWDEVTLTQIRKTGNGTIKELWTEGGNAPAMLAPEVKPNETCVAVGYIELSLALFWVKQDAKYLDAIDKSLYNHMLASIADDGMDFAYYQPNFGAKVRSTEQKMYKCCRYRGFTLFSHMDQMLFFEDSDKLIPMLYTKGRYESGDCSAMIESDYPYDGRVCVTVIPKSDKQLWLRVPKDCDIASFAVNGEAQDYAVKNGYIRLNMKKGEKLTVLLMLDRKLRIEHGKIDGKEHIAVRLGSLLLAANEMRGNEVIAENPTLKALAPNTEHRVRFLWEDIEFCEYASADHYSVWVPTGE